MNERLQILTLLEQGKINADEAERLLEAVSRNEAQDKSGRQRIWASLEGLPKIISSAIGETFAETAETKHFEYPAKKEIVFKGISGNVEVKGTDAERITVDKAGFAKIKESNDSITIKALSDNVTIEAPTKTDLIIASVSGDIRLADIDASVEIESVSGDITGENLAGSLKAEAVSGDIDFDYISLDKIKVKTRSGDVVLRLAGSVEAEMEVEAKRGRVTCEFDLIDKKEKDNTLTGIINEATGRIEITNKYGDVEIKKRA